MTKGPLPEQGTGPNTLPIDPGLQSTSNPPDPGPDFELLTDGADLEAPEGTVHRLEVPAEAIGERLDKFLGAADLGMSRTRLKVLIDEGHVRVGGLPARAAQKLRAGDILDIAIPPPEPTAIKAQDLPLIVVFQDANFVVLNKAAGMATHPAPGTADGTLVNALLHHVKDLSGIGGELRPGIVHRLDKDTSGLIVAAKTDQAHRSLAGQIQAKTATRRYLALAHGAFRDQEGLIDAPIGRHPRDRIKMAVVEGARSAQTRYRVIEEFRDAALVELTLCTGRTHQIRVHLAHIGHPVVGDPVYGGRRSDPMNLDGQLLHAYHLSFDHPVSGKRMEFETKVPPAFERALGFLRRRGYWNT